MVYVIIIHPDKIHYYKHKKRFKYNNYIGLTEDKNDGKILYEGSQIVCETFYNML
jgi:hypothetical protein